VISWVITQRVVVILCQRFGRNLSAREADRLSRNVRNYHHSLRNNPGQRSFHLLRSGNLVLHFLNGTSDCICILPKVCKE
jgi:hypothetical protein